MALCSDQQQPEETQVRRRRYGVQNDDFHSERESGNANNKNKKGQRQQENDTAGKYKFDRNSSSTTSSTPSVSNSNKKMERGISKATENELLVIEARNKVEQDFGSFSLDSEYSNSSTTRHVEPRDTVKGLRAAANAGGLGPAGSDAATCQERCVRQNGVDASELSPEDSPVSSNEDGQGINCNYILEFMQQDSSNTIISTSTTGFIETPAYTFTLPDLTCYQGNNITLQ